MRWAVPVFLVVMGAVLATASVANGHPVEAIGNAILFGVGAAFLAFGRRSQLVRQLNGQADDERLRLVELRATAMAGQVLTWAVVVAFVVSVIRDVSPMPYAWLGGLGGTAYLLSTAWLRRNT
jgi:hypothetical protein